MIRGSKEMAPASEATLPRPHEHQDAHRASPQRGALLQGGDVLPVVQPALSVNPFGEVLEAPEFGAPAFSRATNRAEGR
jgi:hypothetical protein